MTLPTPRDRSANEWWAAPSGYGAGYGARDYFRVETTEGRRFWIFRSLAPSVAGYSVLNDPKWFLHGVFP
jgi:protein ImuB